MKIINVLTLFVLFTATAYSQENRRAVDTPALWLSPFNKVEMLQHIHDAFGKGLHREFVATEPLSEVITSRLNNGGKVWEIGTMDAFYIDFYRSESPSGERERIFTATRLIYDPGSLILVDVVEEQNDISLLAAGFEDYVCFRLKRKPIPQAGVGHYILEPYAINSPGWYGDAVISLDHLGHRFAGGDHPAAFKSIKLASLTTIELELQNQPSTTEIVDFSSGIPLKNGVSVQRTEQPCPPKSSVVPRSEEFILRRFGIPAGNELKWAVLHVEGGQTRVFEVLDQLSNQTEVPAIKQRIVESLESNP